MFFFFFYIKVPIYEVPDLPAARLENALRQYGLRPAFTTTSKYTSLILTRVVLRLAAAPGSLLKCRTSGSTPVPVN